MCPAENDIQSRLLNFYQKQFPAKENVQILDLTRISDGWENEVYSFTICYEESARQKHEDLILRIYPGDDAAEKSANEFNIMKRLYEVGYPVPEVLLLEPNSPHLGKPFVIMEKVDGQSLKDAIDKASDKKKQELVTLFCRMFVELHSLDWRYFVPEPSLYLTEELSAIVSSGLTQFQERVRNFRRTEFDPVFDWLKERTPDVQFERLSLIHCDYHPQNILLRNDGAAFVIDWGSARVSDFRLDLALTFALTSTYGNPEVREIILAEYERIAGLKIEQIEYFEVVAYLVRLFNISVSLSDGAAKLGMRPGAEALMKKNVGHIENVYELLRDTTDIAIPEIENLLETLSR